MASLQPDLTTAPAVPSFRRTALPAWLLPIALVVFLTWVWTFQHWTALSAGRLPDTDDMMRLAQIRDWIDGQPFSDLSQHRLGVDGLAMHWSRIGDVGASALILLFRPFLGVASAELAAVIVWPALLFICLLFVLRRIAHDLAGPSITPIVTVIGSLAYPAIASFMPGRIDHHGLQAVFVALVVAAMTAPPSLRAGLVGGAASAASLALGLETVPLLIVAMGCFGLMWATRGQVEDNRVWGFSSAFALIFIAALVWLRPSGWNQGWCDALTPSTVRILLLVSAAWCVVAMTSAYFVTRRARLAVCAVTGLSVMATAASWSPICFAGPYGPVDPIVMRLWMANVAEAGPLFGSGGVGLAWAQGGLIAVASGVLALSLMFQRDLRQRGWPFALLFFAGAAMMFVQIRLTYIVAALAAVPMAILIDRLRAREIAGRQITISIFAAWITATGIVHGLLGQKISASRDVLAMTGAGPSCTDAEAMGILSHLPLGRIVAPIDAGAYVIGMTGHAAMAAPYHRNNAGNRLVYDLMLASPDSARKLATGASVRYIMFCPSAFREIEQEAGSSDGLAAHVRRGAVPDWLVPIVTQPGLSVFRTDFD